MNAGIIVSIISIFVFFFLKILIYAKPNRRDVFISVLEVPTDLSLFGFLLLLSAPDIQTKYGEYFGAYILIYISLIAASIMLWKTCIGAIHQDQIQFEIRDPWVLGPCAALNTVLSIALVTFPAFS